MFLGGIFGRGGSQEGSAPQATSGVQKSARPMTNVQKSEIASDLQISLGFKKGIKSVDQPTVDQVVYGVQGAEVMKSFKDGTWRKKMRARLMGLMGPDSNT
jgi:hypothetical protein